MTAAGVALIDKIDFEAQRKQEEALVNYLTSMDHRLGVLYRQKMTARWKEVGYDG